MPNTDPMTDSEMMILELLRSSDGYTFGSIAQETGLSRSTCSESLRDLQDRELVTRDYRDRRFKATSISLEALLLQDVAKFITARGSRNAAIGVTPKDVPMPSVEMGAIAEVVTERDEGFLNGLGKGGVGAKEYAKGLYKVLMEAQEIMIELWTDHLLGAYPKADRTVAFDYLTTLGAYMKRNEVKLPMWSFSLPFVPKYHPSGEVKSVVDVFCNAIEYGLTFESTRDRFVKNPPSYIDAMLRHVRLAQKTKGKQSAKDLELESTLSDKNRKRICETFLTACVPPKTVLILPIARFSDVAIDSMRYHGGSKTKLSVWDDGMVRIEPQ